MPIKKPKPVKMPTPFAAQELSDDDDARRRAILIEAGLRDPLAAKTIDGITPSENM